jgi:hypothetical protein
MSIIKVPKPLRDKLGDDGMEGLIEMLNKQEEQTKDSVIQSAVDRFERRLTEEVSGLRIEIHRSKSDTIKWMFIFSIGQVAALGGLLFAVLR